MKRKEYNKIVDLHSDALYRFLLKSCKEEELSKDIVQDTFEKLWIHLDKVDFKKAKSFLFTTAYRKLIDVYRKTTLKQKFENQIDEPVHHQQYSDLEELLQKAMDQLPEIQRTVVLLRDYEGYSYDEIAHITNLSASQVKVYIYRARVYLKNYIGSVEAVV